jgi:hypothetical protein
LRTSFDDSAVAYRNASHEGAQLSSIASTPVAAMQSTHQCKGWFARVLAVVICSVAAVPALGAAARSESVHQGANRMRLASNEVAITSAMDDAILQNTPGYSEAYPAGVPRSYAWCSGSYRPAANRVPPPDFTAVTGWGQIYPKAGAPQPVDPDATVEIAHAKTFLHVKASDEWILVQDQTKTSLTGSHFVSDFAPKPGLPMKRTATTDGSMSIGIPPKGYNSHFWIIERGVYPAGSIDGVYVEMDMRTTNDTDALVANVGADWWRNATAPFVKDFSNNPGAGMSNWIELRTAWSTLRFYSMSTSPLSQSKPLPLADFAPLPGSPPIKRKAHSLSPCASGQGKQAP